MAGSYSAKTTGNTGEGRGSGRKGPAKGHAFGIASVTQALEGASFPISKEELIREHGDAEIHWTKNSTDTLADFLDEVDQDEFQVASAVSESCKNLDSI